MSNVQEQAAPQTETDYMGVPSKPKFGTQGNKTVASVTMVITSGPLAGWEFPFTVNQWGDNLKFDIPRLKAVGWKAKSTATFVSDVEAFIATGKQVMFRARLAVNPNNGSTWWTASSIGRYEPQVKPATQDDVERADSFLADYDIGEPAPRQTQAAPKQDRSPEHTTGFVQDGAEDVPVVHDDDLPF